MNAHRRLKLVFESHGKLQGEDKLASHANTSRLVHSHLRNVEPGDRSRTHLPHEDNDADEDEGEQGIVLLQAVAGGEEGNSDAHLADEEQGLAPKVALHEEEGNDGGDG